MQIQKQLSQVSVEMIASFAKANKVSKAKIQALFEQVLQNQPLDKTRERSKRDEYHNQVLNFAMGREDGKFTRQELEDAGMKMVAFATRTLEENGTIVRVAPKKVDGKSGRPSVTYQLASHVEETEQEQQAA